MIPLIQFQTVLSNLEYVYLTSENKILLFPQKGNLNFVFFYPLMLVEFKLKQKE